MRAVLALAVITVVACADKGDDDAVVTDTAPALRQLSIQFDPQVGGVPFACTQEFQNIGSSSAVTRFGDFRMYVMNVGLTDATGNTTLLTLDEGPFQRDGIVLLDFEDGTWNCEDFGDSETHMEVTGTVPNDGTAYTGLAFTVGVPFELNHPTSTANAQPPLANPAMFRGQPSGYYFVKVEATTPGEPDGYPIHIHSSGCSLDQGGQVASCTSPNRRTWTFNTFDPDTQKVVVDLARLLERNNLNQNSSTPPPNPLETTPGCRSEPNDPDCQDLFVSYGLSAAPPTWVSVE